MYINVRNPDYPYRSPLPPPPPFEINNRGGRVGKKTLKIPSLAGQSREHFMSAHVVSKRPIPLALGAPLLACTRRAAPDAGPGVLVRLFLQFTTTQISDTDMRHSLYQTQQTSICLFP